MIVCCDPGSCSKTFDVDLEEIIHLMRDRPSGQIVRCSKVRSMFAMRACRKSVMIGMPLNPHHMTTVSVTFHFFSPCINVFFSGDTTYGNH